MTQVDAIYQNGVFKPLQGVGLPENQRVRLSVQNGRSGGCSGLAWRSAGVATANHRPAWLLSRQQPGHRRGPEAMSDTVVDSIRLDQTLSPKQSPQTAKSQGSL